MFTASQALTFRKIEADIKYNDGKKGVTDKPDKNGNYIFTPWELSLEILGHIPDIITKTVLVVDSVEFIPVLLALGVNKRNITFACPYDHMNKIAKALDVHVLQNSIRDLSPYDPEKGKPMRFDVIVGNPPYTSPEDRQAQGNKVKGYKQPLWSLFVKLSTELVKKDGYIGMITPTGWLAGTYDIREGRVHLIDIFTNQMSIKFVNADSKFLKATYFKDIGSTFSYYVVKNSPYDHITKLVTEYGESIVDFSRNKVLPPAPHPLKISINNKTLFSVLPKFNFASVGFSKSRLNTDTKESTDVNSYKGYCNGGQLGKVMHSWWPSPDQYYGIRKVILGKQDRSYLPFVDDNGLCIGSNQFWFMPLKNSDLFDPAVFVFNSKLFRFLLMENKHGAGPETILVKNLPAVDLSRSWTDEELYDHFGLTEEERLHIDPSYKA